MKKILSFILFLFISFVGFSQVSITRIEGGVNGAFYFKGVGTPAAEAANITAAVNSMSPGRGLLMGDKYLKGDDGEQYEYKVFAAVAQWRKVTHGAP